MTNRWSGRCKKLDRRETIYHKLPSFFLLGNYTSPIDIQPFNYIRYIRSDQKRVLLCLLARRNNKVDSSFSALFRFSQSDIFVSEGWHFSAQFRAPQRRLRNPRVIGLDKGLPFDAQKRHQKWEIFVESRQCVRIFGLTRPPFDVIFSGKSQGSVTIFFC